MHIHVVGKCPDVAIATYSGIRTYVCICYHLLFNLSSLPLSA